MADQGSVVRSGQGTMRTLVAGLFNCDVGVPDSRGEDGDLSRWTGGVGDSTPDSSYWCVDWSGIVGHLMMECFKKLVDGGLQSTGRVIHHV
jgi:hypothetical protein